MAIRRLFADLETAPNIVYSWRVGYKINLSPENIIKERNIICVAWKWEGEKKVKSIAWDGESDVELIREFMEVMNDSDEVVFHNGDHFDLPWLRARCVKHGIPCFPTYKTVDTLKWARTFYFNSNKLDYLSQYLGGVAKLPTGFDLWKRVMSGEKKALKTMVDYCKNDVTMLENVYHELAPYCPHKTNIAVLEGGERWHCVHCASKDISLSKTRVSAMGIPRYQLVCNDCHKYFTVSNTTYNKMLEEE